MMGGAKKHPTSAVHSSPRAFSATGWGPREPGWVVGVLPQGQQTSMLQGHNHASPQSQNAQM